LLLSEDQLFSLTKTILYAEKVFIFYNKLVQLDTISAEMLVNEIFSYECSWYFHSL